jgi:hypothetical protein
VEEGWFFFIHPVVVTCVQQGLLSPRVVQLYDICFVSFQLHEFFRLGHIAAYDVIQAFM